jgi:ubiquinone/menaquinone biosynthesis C-methylase UbiE
MKADIKKNILKNFAYGYSLTRTGSFAIQGIILPLIDLLSTGKKREAPVNYPEHLKAALPKIQSLLESDSENISMGLYPLEVLKPENPIRHSLRLPQIFQDAFKSAQRREKKSSHEFDEEAQDFTTQLPEYYTRNFHYQTSGYLGEISAELYEHQVEILFSGAAAAMRRLLLPQMKLHFQNSDGEGLHFLEIASGTGAMTRFLALTFPKAQITCVDLSPFYLNKAQKKLNQFKRIDYIQGAAENLNFKDQTYDAIVSCFLFHELPFNVRRDVIQEGLRILKPMGFYGMIDSLQKNDDQDFQWALDRFPVDFHEPFYKNYIDHPIESLFEDFGLKNIESKVGFLSKAVSAVKIS